MTTHHTTGRGHTRPRTTVPLACTAKTTPAHLSFEAEMALAYAAAYLFRAGRVRVPASGIVRAALVAYAARLDSAEEAQAFREAQRACAARAVSPEDRQMAELRLHSVPAEEPLPAFGAILRGHDSAGKMAALTARAEATADRLLGVSA